MLPPAFSLTHMSDQPNMTLLSKPLSFVENMLARHHSQHLQITCTNSVQVHTKLMESSIQLHFEL